MFFIQEEFFTAVGLLARDDMSMKHKTKTADCQGRIHDNRRSHFQFGSDVESKHSEKVGSDSWLNCFTACCYVIGRVDSIVWTLMMIVMMMMMPMIAFNAAIPFTSRSYNRF